MGPFARGARGGVAALLLLLALRAMSQAAARGALDFGASQPVPLGDAGEAWIDEGGGLEVDDVGRVAGLPWQPTSGDAIYPLHR